MKMCILGTSGLEVSEIGIGCWAIGGPDWNLNMEMGWGGTDDEQSIAGLHQAYELGANHYDTADVYGHGHSERLIGKFLKEVPRDQIVVGTKVGYFQGCAPHAYHPLQMRHQLETSLSNLGTTYVDIYYLHNLYFGKYDQYLDDAVEAMYRFKEEGKVRVIGQRGPHSYAPHRKDGINQYENKYERFLKVVSRVKPAVIQVRYNMISPTFDTPQTDIFAWGEANHIGVVINKPLGQGLLLDKYDPDNPPQFTPGDHRCLKRWFSSEGLRVLHRRLAQIKEHFGCRIDDLVRVALQYCLARSRNACVVAGFKNPAQVKMNLTATGKSLSPEDMQVIQRIMEGINEEIGTFFRTEVSDDSSITPL